MIVVIGAVSARGLGPDVTPDGLASGIALTAAGAGARVEVVSRVGEDPAGDAVLLGLAAGGVGHAATLRDPARATPIVPDEDEIMDPDPDPDPDPEAAAGSEAADRHDAGPVPTLDAADVGLALRYLTDYRVIVAIHPTDPGVLAEVRSAATYASAHLVVVADPRVASPEAPDDALVIAVASDATGVADLLGRYAAAVDGGADPAEAFSSLSAVSGIDQP